MNPLLDPRFQTQAPPTKQSFAGKFAEKTAGLPMIPTATPPGQTPRFPLPQFDDALGAAFTAGAAENDPRIIPSEQALRDYLAGITARMPGSTPANPASGSAGSARGYMPPGMSPPPPEQDGMLSGILNRGLTAAAKSIPGVGLHMQMEELRRAIEQSQAAGAAAKRKQAPTMTPHARFMFEQGPDSISPQTVPVGPGGVHPEEPGAAASVYQWLRGVR